MGNFATNCPACIQQWKTCKIEVNFLRAFCTNTSNYYPSFPHEMEKAISISRTELP